MKVKYKKDHCNWCTKMRTVVELDYWDGGWGEYGSHHVITLCKTCVKELLEGFHES